MSRNPGCLAALARPSIRYAILGLLFGLAFSLAMPPLEVADEPQHFFRTYQITQGDWIAVREGNRLGGPIPDSLVRTERLIRHDIYAHPENKRIAAHIREALEIPLDPDQRSFVVFSGSGLYNPLPYLPAAGAITVGKWAGAPPVVLTYLGRWANLLAATLIIALAIRITPAYQNVLTLLALMPMTVHQLASLSPDALAISLSFLLFAGFLRLAWGPGESVSTRAMVGLTGLAALVSLSKSVYFPLTLLVFLIPARRMGGWRRHLTIGGAMVAFSAALFLAWGTVAGQLTVTHLRGGMPFPMAKLFILSHPFGYLERVVNNLTTYLPFYLHSFVGMLGWLNIELSVAVVAVYLTVLVVVSLVDGPPMIGLTPLVRLLLLVVVGACVFLIITSQYFIWTRITSESIGQAQGRYFIPAAPVICALFHNRRLAGRISRDTLGIVSAAVPSIILVYAIGAVITRYYL